MLLRVRDAINAILQTHARMYTYCCTQVEGLERSVMLQEQRMEAMSAILQGIEQLLRNQRPPTIKVAAPPLRRRR